MLPHRQDQKKDSLHGSWVYLFCQSSPFIICEHAQLSSTAVNRSCSSTNALTITVMNGVALRIKYTDLTLGISVLCGLIIHMFAAADVLMSQ